MAAELKGALDQVKTDIAAVTNVQSVTLGPILDAIPEAQAEAASVSITLTNGRPLNDALTSTSEAHRIGVRMYWLLQPITVELVEQNLATMWDLVMTKFFGSDADRNLSENCTLALVGTKDGSEPYRCGYEVIGGKQHRVMIIPIEVLLDTHSV